MESVLGLLACLALAGCGFRAVAGDAGAGDGGASDDLACDDLAVGGGGDADRDLGGAGTGGGADLALDMAANDDCTTPQLLVGISNVTPGQDKGGSVARFALGGDQPRACRRLTAQGTLAWRVAAVSAFDDAVAVIDDYNAYVIDRHHDILRWQRETQADASSYAVDVMALQDPEGRPLLAAAYARTSSDSGVRAVAVLDRDGVAPPKTPWCVQLTGCATQLPLSLSVYGMAADPAQRTHLLALDGTLDEAAFTVDPYAMTRASIIGKPSLPLRRIAATRANNVLRYAWVTWVSDGTANGVVWVDDSGGGRAMQGPVRCGDGSCHSIVQAVPDPTSNDRFFLLCDANKASERQVMALDSAGHCSVVLDGKPLGVYAMLTALAVAP